MPQNEDIYWNSFLPAFFDRMSVLMRKNMTAIVSPTFRRLLPNDTHGCDLDDGESFRFVRAVERVYEDAIRAAAARRVRWDAGEEP